MDKVEEIVKQFLKVTKTYLEEKNPTFAEFKKEMPKLIDSYTQKILDLGPREDDYYAKLAKCFFTDVFVTTSQNAESFFDEIMTSNGIKPNEKISDYIMKPSYFDLLSSFLNENLEILKSEDTINNAKETYQEYCIGSLCDLNSQKINCKMPSPIPIDLQNKASLSKGG